MLGFDKRSYQYAHKAAPTKTRLTQDSQHRIPYLLQALVDIQANGVLQTSRLHQVRCALVKKNAKGKVMQPARQRHAAHGLVGIQAKCEVLQAARMHRVRQALFESNVKKLSSENRSATSRPPCSGWSPSEW